MNSTPKKLSKYGCCWRCGEELPCTSLFEGGFHTTRCRACGAASNFKRREDLPGYTAILPILLALLLAACATPSGKDVPEDGPDTKQKHDPVHGPNFGP